jgi:hypothetical protein
VSFELSHIIQQLAENSGETPDQFRWNKIIAVCGPGGSRVDAVTAWLDNQLSLTGCIQPNWRIEPATGRTALPNYNLWLYDRFSYNKPINDDLSWLQSHHSESGVSLVQKHHNPDHLNDLLWEDLRPRVNYLYITPSSNPELLIDMVWEFVTKTILRPPWRPQLYGFSKDSAPTKELVSELIRGNLLSHIHKVYNFSVDVNFIDYTDIVSLEGSYKICQLLDIQVPEYQHEIWRRGLAAGQAQPCVHTFGIEWTRDDVAKIYNEVIKL